MIAYELLAKLRHLTLTVTDGEIEWIGTFRHWMDASEEEQKIIREWELRTW